MIEPILEIASVDYYAPPGLEDHQAGLTLTLREEDGLLLRTWIYTATLSLQSDDTLDIAVLDEDGRTLSTEYEPDVDRVATGLIRDEWRRMQAEDHAVVV